MKDAYKRGKVPRKIFETKKLKIMLKYNLIIKTCESVLFSHPIDIKNIYAMKNFAS